MRSSERARPSLGVSLQEEALPRAPVLTGLILAQAKWARESGHFSEVPVSVEAVGWLMCDDVCPHTGEQIGRNT